MASNKEALGHEVAKTAAEGFRQVVTDIQMQQNPSLAAAVKGLGKDALAGLAGTEGRLDPRQMEKPQELAKGEGRSA